LSERLLGDFVGPDYERRELMHTEGRREGGVGSIAAARHKDAANTRDIMARVEGIPLSAQEDLRPGAAIHRVWRRRHADVAEIASAVTGRDVHAPTQGDGQMHEIAADTDTLAQRLQCGRLARAAM
jgi:CRISPR/Cas system-associated exonuclease Cas4 (RecB family)